MEALLSAGKGLALLGEGKLDVCCCSRADDRQTLPDDIVHTGKAFHHCAHACGVQDGTSG